MICSSVNLDCFIRPSLRWAGLSLPVEDFRGVTSRAMPAWNRSTGLRGGAPSWAGLDVAVRLAPRSEGRDVELRACARRA